jgi:hypothetical protein
MSNVSPLMLLQLFKRLGIGALYGAGFAAGAIAILAAVLGGIGQFSLRTEPRSTSLTPAASDFRGVDEQLVFTSRPATVTTFGTLAVVGSVENKGPAIPGYVNVYADFFESDGSILYQCMHQFSDGLAAGKKEYFVIECHGMKKELAPRYASHKLHARRMR